MRSGILILLAVLITYGSLYPFRFAVPAAHEEAWIRLFTDWSTFTSRGDVLGNLALFVPFGFAGALSVPGQRTAPLGNVPLVLLAFLLAAVLQMVQIYFVGRTPAVADVIWNMVGSGLGMVAAQQLGAHVRVRWQGWQPAHAIPLALLALWIAAELLPLVPSLDLQSIKNSVKALRDLHVSLPNVLWHAAGVLIGGSALAAMVDRARVPRLLALLVVAIAVGKLLVLTRMLSPSTVLGLAAGFGGWCVIAGWRRRVDVVVLGALLVAYTLKALQPFEFLDDPRGFSWIPFAAMLQGAMLINTMVLVESVFFFAAMLGLVRMRGSPTMAASVVLAAWVGGLEAMQMFIVGRSPDITEPLLVLIVGVVLDRMPPAAPAPAPLRRPAR